MFRFSFSKSARGDNQSADLALRDSIRRVLSDPERGNRSKSREELRDKSLDEVSRGLAIFTTDPEYGPRWQVHHPDDSGLTLGEHEDLLNSLRGHDDWTETTLQPEHTGLPYPIPAFKHRNNETFVKTTSRSPRARLATFIDDFKRRYQVSPVTPTTPGSIGVNNPSLEGIDTSLCECGEPEEKHTTAQKAVEHYEATGEHLETHRFLPISERLNRAANCWLHLDSRGLPDTAQDIPALESCNKCRPEDPNPGCSVCNGTGYKNTEEVADTRNEALDIRRRQVTQGRNFITVVDPRSSHWYHVLTQRSTQTKKSSRTRLAEVAGDTEKERSCPTCSGAGTLTPNMAEDIAPCTPCSPGHRNYKWSDSPDTESMDARSLELVSIGQGGGKVKVMGDAPCSAGCDHGFHYPDTGNKFVKSDLAIPCNHCNATGLEPQVGGGSIQDCPDCAKPIKDEQGRAIMGQNGRPLTRSEGFETTTNSEVCPTCDGSGRETKTKSPRNPTVTIHESGWGNRQRTIPCTCHTEHVHYQDVANKDCTRCHGDLNYEMPGTGRPCNCRISHSGISRRVVPSGVELSGNIPMSLLHERGEGQAFSGLPVLGELNTDRVTSPYALESQRTLNTGEPLNPRTIRRMDPEASSTNTTGYLSPAIEVGDYSAINESVARVQGKHDDVATNTAYVRGLRNTATRAGNTLPLSVPTGSNPHLPKPEGQVMGRQPIEEFHPDVQSKISEVEEAVQKAMPKTTHKRQPGLGLHPEAGKRLDDVYTHLSWIAHHQSNGGDPKAILHHTTEYLKAREGFLKQVRRLHGQEVHEIVKKKIDKLLPETDKSKKKKNAGLVRKAFNSNRQQFKRFRMAKPDEFDDWGQEDKVTTAPLGIFSIGPGEHEESEESSGVRERTVDPSSDEWKELWPVSQRTLRFDEGRGLRHRFNTVLQTMRRKRMTSDLYKCSCGGKNANCLECGGSGQKFNPVAKVDCSCKGRLIDTAKEKLRRVTNSKERFQWQNEPRPGCEHCAGTGLYTHPGSIARDVTEDVTAANTKRDDHENYCGHSDDEPCTSNCEFKPTTDAVRRELSQASPAIKVTKSRVKWVEGSSDPEKLGALRREAVEDQFRPISPLEEAVCTRNHAHTDARGEFPEIQKGCHIVNLSSDEFSGGGGGRDEITTQAPGRSPQYIQTQTGERADRDPLNPITDPQAHGRVVWMHPSKKWGVAIWHYTDKGTRDSDLKGRKDDSKRQLSLRPKGQTGITDSTTGEIAKNVPERSSVTGRERVALGRFTTGYVAHVDSAGLKSVLDSGVHKKKKSFGDTPGFTWLRDVRGRITSRRTPTPDESEKQITANTRVIKPNAADEESTKRLLTGAAEGGSNEALAQQALLDHCNWIDSENKKAGMSVETGSRNSMLPSTGSVSKTIPTQSIDYQTVFKGPEELPAEEPSPSAVTTPASEGSVEPSKPSKIDEIRQRLQQGEPLSQVAGEPPRQASARYSFNSGLALAVPCRICDKGPFAGGKGAIVQTGVAADGITPLFGHKECSREVNHTQNVITLAPGLPIERDYDSIPDSVGTTSRRFNSGRRALGAAAATTDPGPKAQSTNQITTPVPVLTNSRVRPVQRTDVEQTESDGSPVPPKPF